MSAKQVSRAANRGDPNRRSKEVEQDELPPWHVQRSRQQRGQHAHAKDESRKKHGRRPVAIEKPLAPGHTFRANGEDMPVTFDQRTPTVTAQSKTQLSAQRRGHGADHNDPGKRQFAFGIGQKAGQQQNGLTRQRQASIFQQQ